MFFFRKKDRRGTKGQSADATDKDFQSNAVRGLSEKENAGIGRHAAIGSWVDCKDCFRCPRWDCWREAWVCPLNDRIEPEQGCCDGLKTF